MWYTGIDPFTKKPVTIAKGLSDRKTQRALVQVFEPENYFEVREAPIDAGRGDLIGGCDGPIPANPPPEALEKRRREANRAFGGDGDHDHDRYHTVSNPAKGEKPGGRGAGPPKPTGYRPGRKSQKRRQEKRKSKPGPAA